MATTAKVDAIAATGRSVTLQLVSVNVQSDGQGSGVTSLAPVTVLDPAARFCASVVKMPIAAIQSVVAVSANLDGMGLSATTVRCQIQILKLCAVSLLTPLSSPVSCDADEVCL